MSEKKSAVFREGILVAVALAVLTVVEYLVAITFDSYLLLIVLAVAKGAMVLYFFMHITSLWSEKEGGH